MTIGKPAIDALMEMLPGAARRVDLGDMTRPVTAARVQALETLLPKVDDWGWKGGKPGEITGSEFVKAYSRAQEVAEDAVESAGFPRSSTAPDADEVYWETLADEMVDMADNLSKQLEPNMKRLGLDSYDIDPVDMEGLRDVAGKFSNLENAGFPRRWTGKLFRAFKGKVLTPEAARRLSAGMSKLSETQRNNVPEVMRILLPQGGYVPPEKLDDVVSLSKVWSDLSPADKETFTALFPGWEGSVEDLVSAAKGL